MKRRTFLQLFGGAAVSVPLVKNLQFEIPEDEDWDDRGEWIDEEYDYDAPTTSLTRSDGPQIGDVIIFDNVNLDVLGGAYAKSDVFDCIPCESLNFKPLSEPPGRNWSREIGKWGEMVDVSAGMSTVTPLTDPTWKEDREGYFQAEWMLVRNKTKGISFARVYLGNFSNDLGDLTLAWNAGGIVMIC